jgi:hypothetical protein
MHAFLGSRSKYRSSAPDLRHYVGNIWSITLFKSIVINSDWMWRIFCKIFSVPHNIVIDVNNVMSLGLPPTPQNCHTLHTRFPASTVCTRFLSVSWTGNKGALYLQSQCLVLTLLNENYGLHLTSWSILWCLTQLFLEGRIQGQLANTSNTWITLALT